MEKKIIIIVGPTASGKTDLSIKLAQAFNGEVINADSTQIFQGTDIATNKITPAEMQGIKHHLLSTKTVTESYSVAEFQKEARELISSIRSQGKTPIIVGGTGLYINALLFNYNFVEAQHIPDFKDRYEHLTNEALWNLLNQQDSQAAQAIHPNNRYRTLRALEIIESSGLEKTQIIQNNKTYYYSQDELIIIGLAPNREQLYQRINQRVVELVKKGLFAEITKAYEACGQASSQAITCIGGREITMFLKKQINYEECIELMQKNNRHYARRQFTWFKNQLQDCTWFEYDFSGYEQICQDILKLIKNIIV